MSSPPSLLSIFSFSNENEMSSFVDAVTEVFAKYHSYPHAWISIFCYWIIERKQHKGIKLYERCPYWMVWDNPNLKELESISINTNEQLSAFIVMLRQTLSKIEAGHALIVYVCRTNPRPPY